MIGAEGVAVAVEDGYVRLAASVPLHGDPRRVVGLLAARSLDWLGDPAGTAEPGGLRRTAVDLRVLIGGEGRSMETFRKAAYVDLGLPRSIGREWEAEIAWRASTAAPLFPVFAGWLTIGTNQLRVDGLYAPPGGIVGRVADRMLLHVAANGTARWLLAEIDRAATRT
jgi:hypothetical protein